MQVTIAGGGVAGSVSAIALRRIGADVTVYEAYPDPAAALGGFVSIANNGMRALAAVDCLDAVQAYGADIPLQRIWSSTGRLLAENLRGRRSIDPIHSITIPRADLVRVLRDAAVRAGAQIVTGRRVVDATQTGDRVHATLDDGATVDSDLLVGADGIWSTVRGVLDTDAPRPAYSGIYTVFGHSSTPTEPGVFNMVMGRGGAFLFGAGEDTTWWAAQVIDPNPDLDAVDLDTLRDRYRHEPQALAFLADVTDMRRPTRDHVVAPVPRWRSDRIVLVGDAAHPVGAGQGASMAMEDVIVLAQRLATEPVPTALASYEDARRARITRMLKVGKDNRAHKKAVGPVRRRVTDAVMTFGLKHFYEKATGWLYAYDVGELPVRA
ncbi:FAD-dependent oxidoreductase [Actinophytocola oryzae]|uniref:2-polyprenyl-6-methoxyphenol hydroxylase-like FAD-dependent oxidoreductase n=1 Tax=Actinophytocola oryzae TaxID=502181 RepID=A0A4R7V2N8_9PSEU|nr:NAD(P)/FAD-dependent oxidoreductase [Actinophytocola oryzae]TDV43628.1 2-polyprenyl-6-methoxyphenol hydroxylase-like FAD-dependent oxidoreductase [Actinophytocola oryzae]